ncbi:hypothetical protein ABKN59_011775 [Abortiporus biennis]
MSASVESGVSAEEQVCSWGFRKVYTWEDHGDDYYKPHTHSTLTTHLILTGTLTIKYPEDDPNKMEMFGPGSRIDVPAGKVHEVWVGRKGCKYVIGE